MRAFIKIFFLNKKLISFLRSHKPKTRDKQRKPLPGEIPKPIPVEQTPEELKKK